MDGTIFKNCPLTIDPRFEIQVGELLMREEEVAVIVVVLGGKGKMTALRQIEKYLAVAVVTTNSEE